MVDGLRVFYSGVVGGGSCRTAAIELLTASRNRRAMSSSAVENGRRAATTPDRIRRLALLDPTQCFGGFSPGYLLHALPVLIRPTAVRTRRLLHWETGGNPIDPAWLDLAGRSAEIPTGRLVTGRRPATESLRGLGVPTLVLLAGRSRAHSTGRIAARARTLLPRGTVTVLPAATHHSLPINPAADINRALLTFLT